MSIDDLSLLLTAGAILTFIRLGLWCLPFRDVQRLVALMGRSQGPRRAGKPSSETVCRAVMAASRCVPRATCLTQALAAQAMLGRIGLSGRLCIGVNKSGVGVFSHAWLEDDRGEILIGHADLAQFARLNQSGGAVRQSAA
jgi:hypothetical protein